MKKAPRYKGGGAVKGEPKNPVKSTIDKTKYLEVLSKPITGDGGNVVGEDQGSLNPDVITPLGYKYHSGTMSDKNIAYEKDGNIYYYNEQPSSASNKYGLVNIGKLGGDTTVKAAPKVTPAATKSVVKPTINPNNKPLDFSNPNMTYDPDTGFYTNPVTGKMIEPIVEQYKNGGKVKGYAEDGLVLPSSSSGPTYTSDYTAARQREQAKILNQEDALAGSKKKGLSSQAKLTGINLAGQGLNAIGGEQDTDMKYGTNSYFDQRNKSMGQSQGIANAVGSIPIVGAFKSLGEGAQNAIAKKDAYGVSNSSDAAIAAGGFLNPLESTTSAVNDIKSGKFTGKTAANLLLPGVGSIMENKEKKAERAKLQAESDASAAAEQKKLNDAISAAKVSAAIDSRNAGDLNQTSFKDGGQIKGKGTGKSDSIKAKVEAGSFIVPAENAEIAEELREKVLRKAPKRKANLNQKGGEEIKVSNGEHSFTPEEKAELESYGYDLFDLAPNSEHNPNKLKNGGLTPDKARIMLKDGTANGKLLTNAQKKYFGYVIGSENKYAGGGDVDSVKNNNDFEKEELAKIEAKRKAEAKRLGEARAKANAEAAKRKLAVEIRQGLQKQLEDKKRYEAEVKKNEAEYNEMRKEYEQYAKNSADELSRPASFKEQYVGASSRPTSEDVNKEMEGMLKALNEKKAALEESKKGYDYASDEKNYIKDYLGTRDSSGTKKAPSIIKSFIPSQDRFSENNIKSTPIEQIDETVTTTGGGKGKRPSVKETISADVLNPNVLNQIPTAEPSLNLYNERTPDEIARASQRAVLADDVAAQQVGGERADNSAIDPNAGTPLATNATSKKKFDYNDILGKAINYGIPLTQTLVGLNQLKKAGDRPVDSLDPDYIASLGKLRSNVNQADRQAKYGYTGAEKAYLENQNNNLTNAGRFAARNLSGGSGASMLNAERSVINDAFGRKLQMSVNDKNLQLQKQNAAFNQQQAYNSAIQDKQDRLRQYFGDDLNAWHQKTGSAANLANIGMSNALDSYRAEQRLKNYNSQQTNTP